MAASCGLPEHVSFYDSGPSHFTLCLCLSVWYSCAMQYVSPQKDPGIFQSFVLTNGITVYHRPTEQPFGLPKVACSVLVNVGGRDDPAGKEGSAHFFEHMPFRGTTHFPTLNDLSQVIEANGGYINAFTTDEATGYEIVVPTELLEEGVRRVADMLLNPLLRNEDIEIERMIILEELRNKLANVNFFARQELYKGLLGDHPLVHSVIGSESALKSVSRDDLYGFHQRYYGAKNISLFFAGSYNRETLRAMCEKYFGTIITGEATNRQAQVASKVAKEYKQVLTPTQYNRSVYLLGRLLPSLNMRGSVIMKLFVDMLTRGMSSPLHEEIREKRGLAYNLGMYTSTYQDNSILMFSVSTQFAKMEEVDAIFWREVERILDNEDRFKEVLFTVRQSALHREHNVSSLVDDAIEDVLDYGRIISLQEYIEELESVTLAELKHFVHPFLNQSDYFNVRVNCDKSPE